MSVDNPIINNPYLEPKQHYATDADGSLNYLDIREGRRHFTPDVQVIPIKQGPQGSIFDVNDLAATYEQHLINLVRKEAGKWREEGYSNTTRVTKELLQHWFGAEDGKPARKLFFAQREAIETAIWLNEVAERSNPGQNILQQLKEAQHVGSQEEYNLPRIAFKMATGTGKTVVMAALILYHFFNRQEYRNDTRYADYFLLVAPGITIRDRLGVLFVDTRHQDRNLSRDYYRMRGLVPQKMERQLPNLNARITITNFHAFEPKLLQGNKRSPFDGKRDADGKKVEAREDFAQVVKRVLSKFKSGSRLLILNDEAHHCYLPKAKGKKNDEDNSEEENARAAVWFRGISEIAQRFKVQAVYDLSATPYYLNGSGYQAYSLFPWVVSDFGLIEAIESGLVKIPFLRESDNSQVLSMPVLRNLYEHVKHELPKKGAKKEKLIGHPKLPHQVKVALDQFYSHYLEEFNRIGNLFSNPPVFILVCNNTNVSSEVFKYIAGYELTDEKGNITERVPGKFELFTNFHQDTKNPLSKPPTLLIDSDALENSGQVDESFKKIFASEIETFKRDYRTTHPDKSVEQLTDADILREVVNTVGKPGMLGAHIRCVVSVSMLTEGWDANTVTHIMGLRAFGSQLLCEQVAGRALRRRSYEPDPRSKKEFKFAPEYAHIIGVPFKLFKGGTSTPVDPPAYTRIFAIPERQAEYEITFPNLEGYRVESVEGELQADFSRLENYTLDGSKLPTETVMGTAVSSQTNVLTLAQVKEKRDQEIIYFLTKEMLNRHFADEAGAPQFQKFNQLRQIIHEWYGSKLFCAGDTFPKMVYYEDLGKVCNHIKRGIDIAKRSTDKIYPRFNFYNKFGSTVYVTGNTSKEVYYTTKSHVNAVVADTESWEQIAAKALEELEEVQAYVKNAFLGFGIPYVKSDKDQLYFPDFIARCRTARGETVNLIIEITGMNRDKEEKKWYVEHRWLPAVNEVRHEYGYPAWEFIEIANEIHTIKNQIRTKLASM
jgi:type III restriction enzyme